MKWLVGRVLCAVGIHKWGAWQVLSAPGVVAFRRCRRCRAERWWKNAALRRSGLR